MPLFLFLSQILWAFGRPAASFIGAVQPLTTSLCSGWLLSFMTDEFLNCPPVCHRRHRAQRLQSLCVFFLLPPALKQIFF